jgi:hypothetical protein
MLLLAALGAALMLASPAAAHRQMRLGLVDPTVQQSPTAPVLDRMRDTNTAMFRVNVFWSRTAPGGNDKPAGFDARNPADPAYNFSATDQLVRELAARGVEPIFTVLEAPNWAEGNSASDRAKRKGETGTYNPNPAELRDFAYALASRYSGSFAPSSGGGALPRVRYHQVWNEPNFGQYLVSATKSEIPRQYARMLNAYYSGAKQASKSNVVIAAGLGPYGFNGHATDYDPQVFMRAVFCLSGKAGRNLKPRRGCSPSRVSFDAWAQHPYTLEGNPRSKGRSPEAGAIGNMPQIRATLDAAARAKRVSPAGKKPIWITEMGWFSNPPGARTGDGREIGVPLATQARYLSEAAYRMWRLRVEVFLWYALRDYPDWKGGLYLSGNSFAEDKPKPVLESFRFPFYAQRSSKRLLVWGLVHRAAATNVAIERLSGSTWREVARVRSDSRGLFYQRVKSGGRGTYRARALDGAKAGLTSYTFVVR